MKSVNKNVQADLEQIDQEIRKAEVEEQHCRQQIKIMKHKGKLLERKARNHRIFTRGGMLEKFLREPLLVTNEQVFRILQESFDHESVRELEDRLIAESTEALKKEAESEGNEWLS